jgi:hypothetical protein
MVRSALAVMLLLTASAGAGKKCDIEPPPKIQLTYRPPPEVARALTTYRTTAGGPAVAAAKVVFARVPFLGMAAAEVRALLGAPSAITPEAGDERWRYLRQDGEGIGAIHVLRIHRDTVASVVSFPTQ